MEMKKDEHFENLVDSGWYSLNKISEDLWAKSKNYEEYLASLLTISQSLMVEVIVRIAEESEKPVTEVIDHFVGRMKSGIEKYFEEQKDAKQE